MAKNCVFSWPTDQVLCLKLTLISPSYVTLKFARFFALINGSVN